MKKRQIKILLIEDNPGDVRLIREMLSEATDVIPKIECIDRLDAGLKRLAKGDINLLLLDLGLPDSKGLDTFVNVHTHAPEVPTVVLTGLEDEELGLKAVQMGAQDYLIKGQVMGNILIRTVRYAIERKRIEEELKKHRDHLEELASDRKKAEEQIRASLTEKEVLLQEIHHRVKNNMQIISSLIKLQSRHIKDEKALGTFKSIQNRVRSMAVIHEQLYKSKDFARVDFAEYVQILTVHLLSAYGIDSKAIKLNIEIKDVLLDIDTAIPCGLIINELISNSLIHAFPEEKKGEINITVQYLNKNEIELIVSDNGVGLPKKMDFRDTESMGLHLVTILAEDQLQGDIKLDRTGGTRFYIRIKVSQ